MGSGGVKVARLGALLVTLALVGGCGGGDDDSAATKESAKSGSKEPIIIGSSQAATGVLGGYDKPAQITAEIAIDQINKDGGVLGRQLKLIKVDTKSDPERSGPATLDLIEKGAQFVIVPADFGFASAGATAANDKGVVAMSTMAGAPQMGPQGVGPFAYTMATGSLAEGTIMAEWGFEEQGYKRAYTLLDAGLFGEFNKALCRGFESRWKELGGEVVGSDTFVPDDPSFSPQVNKLGRVKANADVVFLCSSSAGASALIKEMRSSGVDLPLMATAGFDGDDWTKAIPGLSNMYHTAYASVFGDDPDPKVKEVLDAYKKRTGAAPPHAFALTGHPTVEAYARAVEKAGTTEPDAVRKALDSFKDVPLLLGPTSFTPELHLNLQRPMAILEIRDGKHRFVTRRGAEKQLELTFE